MKLAMVTGGLCARNEHHGVSLSTAKRLPAGAKLVFQMHYTPNGTATTDQTRIGLKFASEPPQYEVKTSGIVNPRIKIPPHAAIIKRRRVYACRSTPK